MQGHRNHMEDRTVTRSYFYPNLKSFSLYIVFDGHGGDEAVKHAAKELSDFVIKKGESIFKPMEKFEDYDVDAIVHCKFRVQIVICLLTVGFSIWRSIS